MSRHSAISSKTILLVDDDTTVVDVLTRGLRRMGYEVFAAETKEQAIAAVKGPRAIDLLMVDAVLPAISGPELAEALLFLRPGMKVLFITGLDSMAIRLAFDGPCTCLQKPFTVGFLASKVEEVLDGGESPGKKRYYIKSRTS